MEKSIPVGDARRVLSFGGRDIECATFGLPLGEEKGLAVICHPHPLFGGTMDNKVVHTLWRTFKSSGINALRFNFRGVGLSEGEYDNGAGETDDLAEIIHWLSVRYPGKPIYLAGFSFGAFVATAYVAREKRAPLARLFLVAPPVHHFNMGDIQHLNVPVSIIMGEKDEVVPVQKVLEWQELLAACVSMRFHLLPCATHFFHGHLGDLKNFVMADLDLG